jgi:hypothetical protein
MQQSAVYKVGAPVAVLPCHQTNGKTEFGLIEKSEFKTSNGTTMVRVSGFPRAVPAFSVNFL